MEESLNIYWLLAASTIGAFGGLWIGWLLGRANPRRRKLITWRPACRVERL